MVHKKYESHSVIYERKLVKEIIPYLYSREAVVIYGARQVGKTSLLQYLKEKHLKTNVFYFDLELPDLLDLCNQSPEQVFSYLLQKGADEKKRIFLIIDEIQYLNDPTKFIKITHDHYPNIKLFVSGSSTFEIKKKFKESLAGRTVNFELYPLSFEEFLIFKKKEYHLRKNNLKIVNDELIPLAEEYIRFGGYPKIVLENSEEKKKIYLSQIINTYIKKDIRDIGNIRNISAFNKLLELLASQSGQILNILELSSTLQIERITVLEYLDLLEQTFIIKRVAPFHKNLRSELSKNPKVFLLDTGMMHLLWLKDFPRVILGNTFETFVFSELLRLHKPIHFWRTTNKQEIDFIISDKELYAVEVKLNFQHLDNHNLKFFAGKYPCKTITLGLKGEKRGKYPWELIKEIE